MTVVCTYEDRASDETGIKLLVASLGRHAPNVSLNVHVPTPSDGLARWLGKRPRVTLFTGRVPDRQGFNVKPWVLKHALDHGAESAMWLDADVMIAGPIAPLLDSLRAEEVLAAEEFFGAKFQGGSVRTRLWELGVGRRMPATVNSCVFRATRRHTDLLDVWDGLMLRPDYQAAMARPWFERSIHMLGDQEVITAVLGASRFRDVPIRWLRRGTQIAQCNELGGYHAHERIWNALTGTRPLFLHAQGEKPWRHRSMHVDVSPYTIEASRYASELDEDLEWTRPAATASTILRWIARDHISLAGLGPAVLWELRKQRIARTTAKRLLSIFDPNR
jgi:hypothetical protein